MKTFVLLAIILISGTFAIAQPIIVQLTPEKALTQAEYVKLLYDLQKSPGKKDQMIETIRRRGIGFPVTDGILSLTRSKSGADPDLKRVLEEAGRRRENPTAYKPPTAEESVKVLAKAREATLAAVEEMPDFVVKQAIQRSVAYAGTNNFQSLDKLVVAVSYRTPDAPGARGAEEYKVLSVNGTPQNNPKPKRSYEEVGGTSSTGEFVTILNTIFKSENQTEFIAVDTDVLRGRKAIIYSFETAREKAKEVIALLDTHESTEAGMKGRIWIDRDNFRVLRVESNATEIPADFRVRSASRAIDYDWVAIADQKYLLPSLSDVRLTSREGKNLFETRNLIRFKEYQKYGTEVKILDDDEIVEEPAQAPNPKPTPTLTPAPTPAKP